MSALPSITDGLRSLDELYAALEPLGAVAGWSEKVERIGRGRMDTKFQPAHWRYRDMRAALEVAGSLVDTRLAERRNLILVNPSDTSGIAATSTVVTAYQMILPGERARSHRHTANALRLILDTAPGVYTIVDGVRFDMSPGDVVLTPNWCWHGHANDGSSTGFWLDYLDAPLLMTLESMAFEPFPGEYQEVMQVAEQSPLLYRWTETSEKLATARLESSGCFGRQIALDAYRFQSIALFMCALDAGTRTSEFATTANNIYSVVAGRGRSTIANRTIAWERGDVIVAPASHPHFHEANGDAVLFRLTDAPTFSALGWLR